MTHIQKYGLCIIFLLLVAPAYAVTVAYETTSVSRLVGNSPEDLINQLDTEELNLNHASYYGQDPLWSGDSFEKKENAIKSMFNDYYIKNSWDYNSVSLDKFKSNELFVVEADKGSIESSRLKSIKGPTELGADKIKNWKNDFAEHYPLFIFDSDYAGLAIPKKDSFVNSLTRYSQIIAPTFTKSGEFVRAMICNLGDSKTLGNSFREARNKYYENVDPSSAELIGITLMSYHLFGNPLAITTTPKYSTSALKKYCGDLFGRKEETPFGSQEFTAQAADNKIKGAIDIKYSIAPAESYQLLEIEGADNIFEDYEVVIPAVIRHHDLPLNAIITGITYTFSSQIDLNINLPQYENNALAGRECYLNEWNESLEQSLVYKEDKQTINLYINPLKAVDCKAGSFRLYQKIEYEISYDSLSPIYFESINYPTKMLPNTQFDLNVVFSYVNDNTLNGEFELYTDDKLIYQKEITTNIPSITIPLTSKNEEGITKYKIRYVENGNILAESEFEIETRTLEYWLEIPEIVKGSAGIKFMVKNNENSPVNIKVYDNLLLDNVQKQGNVRDYVLQPGLNQYSYNYNSLLQSDQKYSLKFDLAYSNKREVLNGVITTNHKPLLAPAGDITARAGDLIKIGVSASDIDGDSISYTISDPVGNDGEWQTKRTDEGEYPVTITASDSYSTDTAVIKIIINPYNRPPQLEDISPIEICDEEIAVLLLYAADADNDNLTYSVEDPRFKKIDYNWFEWQTQAGDAGSYTIKYSASDGKETVSKGAAVNVLACHQPKCSRNSDCGANGWANNTVCKNGHLFNDYKTYTCKNPGTKDAECISTAESRLVKSCTFGCENNLCKEDPCRNVVCSSYYCEGYRRYYSPRCEAGKCVYGGIEDNSPTCGWKKSCSSSSDCNDNLYCNGAETCANGFCTPGTPVSCIPDSISCTRDICDENIDACIRMEDDSLCPNGWYNTNKTQMINNNQCSQKEQRQQEYKNYSCSRTNGCQFKSIASTRWLDTGIKNHPDGVVCNDDLYCTVDDHCGNGACVAAPRSCDDKFSCTMDICDEAAGKCIYTLQHQSCYHAEKSCEIDSQNKYTRFFWTAKCEPNNNPETGTGCGRTKAQAEETACDRIDEDCDGQADEGLVTTFYEDSDKDGYGRTDWFDISCAAPSEKWITTAGDCNDKDSKIYPGAPEICDTKDNDCNGQVDDSCITPRCTKDSDCPADKWGGNQACIGKDVYMDYEDYYCSKPGTIKALCAIDIAPKLYKGCTNGCRNGECI